MTYQEYVNSAKKLIKQIEAYQARIAEMAIAVCQIRHGGKSEGFYTLSDFADDTGLCRKTLSQWVHTYRDVLLKVGISKPSPKEWAAGTKTSNLLKNERTELNREKGTPGSKGSFKKQIPPERVVKIFREVESGDSEMVKLERIYSSVRHTKTMLTEMSLNKLDRKKLSQIMSWLDESSDLINDALTASRTK